MNSRQFVMATVVVVGLFAELNCGMPGPRFGTVGAKFSQDQTTGRVIVRNVAPSPRDVPAGLQPDDEILTIDGRDVRDMDSTELRRSLRGPIGSTVELQVQREGRIYTVTITRSPPKPRASASAD